jgi:hypothetical protein
VSPIETLIAIAALPVLFIVGLPVWALGSAWLDWQDRNFGETIPATAFGLIVGSALLLVWPAALVAYLI